MFQQPTVADQKLKATSGRGNGTNYTAPDGTRVKLKHTPCSVPGQEASERREEPFAFGGESLQWMGRPANIDNRPANPDNRTSGPTVKGRRGF